MESFSYNVYMSIRQDERICDAVVEVGIPGCIPDAITATVDRRGIYDVAAAASVDPSLVTAAMQCLKASFLQSDFMAVAPSRTGSGGDFETEKTTMDNAEQLAARPCVVFDVDNDFLSQSYDTGNLNLPDGTLVVGMEALPDLQQTRFRLWNERFRHWIRDDQEGVFVEPQVVDQMRAAYQSSLPASRVAERLLDQAQPAQNKS